MSFSFGRCLDLGGSRVTKIMFTDLAFRGITGPNALEGIITSKVLPNFSFSNIDSPTSPHSGRRLFLAAEVAGLGGTVRTIRPIVQYTHWTPVQKRKNAIGFNFQGSF